MSTPEAETIPSTIISNLSPISPISHISTMSSPVATSIPSVLSLTELFQNLSVSQSDSDRRKHYPPCQEYLRQKNLEEKKAQGNLRTRPCMNVRRLAGVEFEESDPDQFTSCKRAHACTYAHSLSELSIQICTVVNCRNRLCTRMHDGEAVEDYRKKMGFDLPLVSAYVPVPHHIIRSRMQERRERREQKEQRDRKEQESSKSCEDSPMSTPMSTPMNTPMSTPVSLSSVTSSLSNLSITPSTSSSVPSTPASSTVPSTPSVQSTAETDLVTVTLSAENIKDLKDIMQVLHNFRLIVQ